jgi:hypothetical protein
MLCRRREKGREELTITANFRNDWTSEESFITELQGRNTSLTVLPSEVLTTIFHHVHKYIISEDPVRWEVENS